VPFAPDRNENAAKVGWLLVHRVRHFDLRVAVAIGHFPSSTCQPVPKARLGVDSCQALELRRQVAAADDQGRGSRLKLGDSHSILQPIRTASWPTPQFRCATPRVVSEEREIVMRTLSVVLLAAATVAPATLSAKDRIFDGSAAAIRTVVSGRTCAGTDVITFGRGDSVLAGTFERQGHPSGSYNVGYGTILIRRGDDVHGHIASVNVPGSMLYLSTGTYRCSEQVSGGQLR
jgi:hypothetical protein